MSSLWMRSRWKTVFLATALLGLSAGVAAAATAAVGTDANMRSGPGFNYRVETVIPAGSVIDVGGCSGNWCQVEWAGHEGFVARSLIASAGGGAYAVAPRYEYEYVPDNYVYDPYYYYSPGVGFEFFYDRGHRHRVRRDHRDHKWSGSGSSHDRIDRRQGVIGSQNFQRSQRHVQQSFKFSAPHNFQGRSGSLSRGGPSKFSSPSHSYSRAGHGGKHNKP